VGTNFAHEEPPGCLDFVLKYIQVSNIFCLQFSIDKYVQPRNFGTTIVDEATTGRALCSLSYLESSHQAPEGREPGGFLVACVPDDPHRRGGGGGFGQQVGHHRGRRSRARFQVGREPCNASCCRFGCAGLCRSGDGVGGRGDGEGSRVRGRRRCNGGGGGLEEVRQGGL